MSVERQGLLLTYMHAKRDVCLLRACRVNHAAPTETLNSTYVNERKCQMSGGRGEREAGEQQVQLCWTDMEEESNQRGTP